MRFFVDEAGSFQLPVAGRHDAGVAVSLAVSDADWAELSGRFRAFVSTLDPAELEHGEPKGSLLSSGHLLEFARMLADFDGVSVAPVTMDLGHLSGMDAGELVEPLRVRLEETAGQMLYPRAADQIALLARQTRNLSPEQILRVFTWARALFEGLHHSIVFLSHGDHAASWDTVRVEIDPVQRQPGSREERVLSIMLFSWMAAWSAERPFITLEDIHTDDHPFVQNFCTDEGVSISSLIRPNLHWPNSRESLGLQMADLAARIVHQAVLELSDEAGALTRFAVLMRSSQYGHARGPGLISPLEQGAERAGERYAPLSDVMRRRRHIG